MTRIEKFAKKRTAIELENSDYLFNNFQEWLEIRLNQKQIKKEGGYKH